MTSQSPSGSSIGAEGTSVVRRPWTLPAACRAAVSVSPTDHPPRPSDTATSTSGGAVSSAKPPTPRATSGATRCGAAPSSVARRATEGQVPADGSAGPRRAVPGHPAVQGVVDRAPARAAAEVGQQRLVDGAVADGGRARPDAWGPQRLHPPDDPRGAETALAGPAGQEGIGPCRPLRVAETVDGGDDPARRPPQRCDAGDAGLAVDEHRAAAALALRLQPSFTERTPKRSRSASASEHPSSSTVADRPSTIREITVTGDATSPPGEDRFPG